MERDGDKDGSSFVPSTGEAESELKMDSVVAQV